MSERSGLRAVSLRAFRVAALVVGFLVLIAAAAGAVVGRGEVATADTRREVATAPPADTSAVGYRLTRVADPDRSVVTTAAGTWVATFTDGARTVALAGPDRRFEEGSAAHGVTSAVWVRVLPTPFDGAVDFAWLEATSASTEPDVLAMAMEYVEGAPDVIGADGLLQSADASYGPLQEDGRRAIGADWNDFQDVTAVYRGVRDEPEPDELRSLDCSGFVRMVYGRRAGIPLTRRPDGGASLPRRSRDQAARAPGVVPVVDTGAQVSALDRLQPGDLVFFDARGDRPGIDHVGIYLGPDDAGDHRFISSRASADGPTLGDRNGASILNGDELYARTFRSTRRL